MQDDTPCFDLDSQDAGDSLTSHIEEPEGQGQSRQILAQWFTHPHPFLLLPPSRLHTQQIITITPKPHADCTTPSFLSTTDTGWLMQLQKLFCMSVPFLKTTMPLVPEAYYSTSLSTLRSPWTRVRTTTSGHRTNTAVRCFWGCVAPKRW